ncbi:MAG: hypothetical protein R3C71_13075 [Candidatus Krumholzibacteriia bacterium]
MGPSRASAELLITRDAAGRRAYRAHLFRRGLHPLRDEADFTAVEDLARVEGVTLMLYVLLCPFLIRIGGSWGRSAAIVGPLAVALLLFLCWREGRLIARLRGPRPVKQNPLPSSEGRGPGVPTGRGRA